MARLENTSQNAVLLGLLAIGSLLGLIVSVTTVRESLFSINKRQRGRAEAGYGSHNDESSKEKDNRTSTDPPGKSEARCSERQSEHTALRDHGDRVQDSGAIDAHGCSTSWGNRQSSDVSSTSSSGSRRRSPETSRQVMQQRLCVKSPKIVSEPRNVAELFKKGHSSRVEGESQGTQEHSQRLGLEHGEMLGIKAAASPERNQMPEESPSTPTKGSPTRRLPLRKKEVTKGLERLIQKQGEKIREMKEMEAAPSFIRDEMALLIWLKGQYEEISGRSIKQAGQPVRSA